jgi:hypothetical protein
MALSPTVSAHQVNPDGPAPSRHALAGLSPAALIDRFAVGVERFDARVLKMRDADLDTAFLPGAGVGTWPCRVLLGHLADAEMLFVQRMRKVVGEDHPVLQPWDEQAFLDLNMYGTPETGARYPVGAFVATIHTLRQWTSGWLRTLNDAQWQRTGLHPERGEQSVRVILEYDTWHLEHHAWYLNKKVRRLVPEV